MTAAAPRPRRTARRAPAKPKPKPPAAEQPGAQPPPAPASPGDVAALDLGGRGGHVSRKPLAAQSGRAGQSAPEPEAAPPAPEPAPAAPAPAPVQPEDRRVCAFCLTPQLLSQLAQVATWLECADTAACAERAARSDLYAQAESELELAAHPVAQGAPR